MSCPQNGRLFVQPRLTRKRMKSEMPANSPEGELDCTEVAIVTCACHEWPQKEHARVRLLCRTSTWRLLYFAHQRQSEAGYEEIRNYFVCRFCMEKHRSKKAEQYQARQRIHLCHNHNGNISLTRMISNGVKTVGKWKKLKSIGYEKKTINKKETGEVSYRRTVLLCSITPIASYLAMVSRTGIGI